MNNTEKVFEETLVKAKIESSLGNFDFNRWLSFFQIYINAKSGKKINESNLEDLLQFLIENKPKAETKDDIENLKKYYECLQYIKNNFDTEVKINKKINKYIKCSYLFFFFKYNLLINFTLTPFSYAKHFFTPLGNIFL